ncbi:NADP-dependent isocitrate dehydrogenase [Winogradskyella sp. UBA3174]|uniref:NADP-dependent isocitrate dehydrogenase n=1 Tax=Winogradskyella sp. UBA3174 TaxID=1947785 RepID=UPI0025E59D7B|nr:NADP-dependent isocitrate dehydrogenase [Winogradskyella sp. UBA3174]|tara:strand:+ start:62124 stop:63560 length:1437 start_codon:yes stop_codon:yes gene_type:complete
MIKVSLAKGDGIGPEIMDATLSILSAAGADLTFEEIEVGEKVYLSGSSTGITDEAWATIRRNKVILKAPITTPQGGGYKSLNVTIRKTLGLYSNVRPCRSLYPFVTTKHPDMDVVIIRENEEDLYAGIEHQQTDEVVQCLKLISRPGCEKIVTYAFEYAKKYGRKKVTCFTKDNIMKQTDGLFHQVFDEIASRYPDIINEHWIVDIGAALVADTPENFDVIVMPNLYGDVISDIAAQITGSVGLAGSANIGEECSMFEAIHGSAPDIAGKNVANPSGLINGAVMMLNHVGQNTVAEKVQNAWLKTIEDGVHTNDIYDPIMSIRRVGTKEFAEAVIANLGKTPKQLPEVFYEDNTPLVLPRYQRKPSKTKKVVGVDLFVDWNGYDANILAEELKKLNNDELELSLITNRGVKVWPNGFDETFCTDHWRCRYLSKEGQELSKEKIINILQSAIENNIDAIKTENLYTFDGVRGYSLGQGQ